MNGFAQKVTTGLLYRFGNFVLICLFLLTSSPCLMAQTPPPPPPAPTVQFTASDFCTAENAKKATIWVTLSGDAGQKTVTVKYATSNSTATVGEDYEEASGTLTFEPGIKSQSFEVTIKRDFKSEPSETVQLTLSEPSNADLGLQDKSTLTIWDSPPVLALTAVPSAICAGGLKTAVHQTTVTATFTDGIDPYAGETISFSTTAGTLDAATGTSDANGAASITLTSNSKASEAPDQFSATVTAIAAAGVAQSTKDIEFQPSSVSVTASLTEIMVGDTAELTASVTWNGQPVTDHSLSWRISRIWDEDDILIFSGSGTMPENYGTLFDTSTKTNPAGLGMAKYEAGAQAGKVEIECADSSVELMTSQENPKGKAEEKVKKYKIKIQRKKDGGTDYEDIGPANKEILRGEFIDLKMVVDPAPAKVDKYSWEIPGKNFKDYTSDDKTAKLTPLTAADLGGDTAQFYWTDGGAKTAKATATIGKISFNGTTILTVTDVVIFKTEAKIGSVQQKGGNKDGCSIFLSKDVKENRGGIDFNGRVDVPVGFSEGEWKYVQQVYLVETLKDPDGKKWKRDMNSKWILDVSDPYDGNYKTGKEGKTDDSPGFPDLQSAACIELSTNTSFKMYMMFKPAGAKSRYVPLQVTTWGYKVTALYDAKAETWSPVGASVTKPDSKNTTVHPEWQENAKDRKWIPD